MLLKPGRKRPMTTHNYVNLDLWLVELRVENLEDMVEDRETALNSLNDLYLL